MILRIQYPFYIICLKRPVVCVRLLIPHDACHNNASNPLNAGALKSVCARLLFAEERKHGPATGGGSFRNKRRQKWLKLFVVAKRREAKLNNTHTNRELGENCYTH